MNGIVLQTAVIGLGVFLILGSGGGDKKESPLTAPSNVQVAPAYKGAVLSWTPVSSASSYEVCYAHEKIEDYQRCSDYAGGVLFKSVMNPSAAVDNLLSGRTYYFRVVAKRGDNTSVASGNVSVVPNLGLNDTGIILCGNSVSNKLNCPVLYFPNQDGEFGLDVASPKNNMNGVAGFDFTKLDTKGNELPASANEWACVRDNNTGLTWEAKLKSNGPAVIANDGLHDADDVFTWYSENAANNAGSMGDQNMGGATCYGYNVVDTSTYCNTQAFVQRVNKEAYCGISNWRMPERGELTSIVNYDQVNPSIDLAYFQYTQAAVYLSGTPVFSSASAGDHVWAIDFNYGGSAKVSKQASRQIRLVSNGQ